MKVAARSEEPLITPSMLKSGYTDIAFASSAAETDEDIFLYYSIADRDMCRAALRRV